MRIMEQIIKINIVDHVDTIALLPNSQHGFVKLKSIISNLLEQQNFILEGMENKAEIDSIYSDLEKCFDKLDLKIMKGKLKFFAMGGKILQWLINFVTLRKFVVKVNKSYSSEEKVISGCPQGTVLGPILMLIYNFDMDKYVQHSKMNYFADDAKISKHIYSKDDTDKLKSDLEGLLKWQEENNVKFNLDKFICLKYKQKDFSNANYEINGTKIKEETATRDLGIITNNRGTYEEHIEYITKQCKRLTGMVLRTFQSRDKTVMMTLLKSIILSKLDFGSIVWAPNKVQDLRKIEHVQSNFTRRINGTEGMDYFERLKHLRLYSIERRFERYSVIYVWKI